jgi:hypothetical protein
VIRVSTFSFKASYPSIDLLILFCHSKANGFVTTHTVKAPSSFAISATTGAAHVHVPHPSPQVINTISAQASAAFISSLDSSAAFFPISGLLPAPSPQVITFQILIFLSGRDLNKACASVLSEINSTHSSHHSIILFTAFDQPPPTQTTIIFAAGEIESDIFTSSGQDDFFGFFVSKFFNLSSLFIIVY